MILPQDISPDRSMYVMGSRILEILNKDPHKIADPKLIYDKYMSQFPETTMTYNYFLYAIDWLYLLNAIDLTANLGIKKCY